MFYVVQYQNDPVSWFQKKIRGDGCLKVFKKRNINYWWYILWNFTRFFFLSWLKFNLAVFVICLCFLKKLVCCCKLVNIPYLSLLMHCFIRLSCLPIKILYLVYWFNILNCWETELLIMNNCFRLFYIFLIIDLLIKKNQIASSIKWKLIELISSLRQKM